MKPGDADEAVARRDFLRTAAVVGTGAFAVPMIVTVDPADAKELTSQPPSPPGEDRVTPAAGPRRPVRRQPTARQVPGRSELPSTGADIDRMAAAGLAAKAGGAALVLWSAHMKSESAATPSTDPRPEP
jgi:hypothetical protein